MKYLRYFLFSLLFVHYNSAVANDLVLEAGLHFGGDNLGTAQFVNGDTQSIEAGGLISVAIGTGFELSENLETQLTFGYKFDTVTAKNGDITFSRFPLNAIVLYKSEEWRFGGGLTYHMNPKIDVSGAGAGFASNTNFDDAIGFLADMRYFFSEKAYVGGRLTFIEYETTAGATADGNSVGITIGAML